MNAATYLLARDGRVDGVFLIYARQDWIYAYLIYGSEINK
jgi:hypothetical protein